MALNRRSLDLRQKPEKHRRSVLQDGVLLYLQWYITIFALLMANPCAISPPVTLYMGKDKFESNCGLPFQILILRRWRFDQTWIAPWCLGTKAILSEAHNSSTSIIYLRRMYIYVFRKVWHGKLSLKKSLSTAPNSRKQTRLKVRPTPKL